MSYLNDNENLIVVNGWKAIIKQINHHNRNGGWRPLQKYQKLIVEKKIVKKAEKQHYSNQNLIPLLNLTIGIDLPVNNRKIQNQSKHKTWLYI